MRHTPERSAAREIKLAISVITFDLDNTLWDVTPVLLSAEKVQQEWLPDIAHEKRVERDQQQKGREQVREPPGPECTAGRHLIGTGQFQARRGCRHS